MFVEGIFIPTKLKIALKKLGRREGLAEIGEGWETFDGATEIPLVGVGVATERLKPY